MEICLDIPEIFIWMNQIYIKFTSTQFVLLKLLSKNDLRL